LKAHPDRKTTGSFPPKAVGIAAALLLHPPAHRPDQFAVDVEVTSLSRFLWLQGFSDQAMRSVECQIVDARASDRPWSLANAVQSACPIALPVGELTSAERCVKALMDLSARHAMELWWNLGGRCFGGMLLVKRGDIGAGLELLRTASARVPENAFIMLLFPLLTGIADALRRDGQAAEGLPLIDAALGRSERSEERLCVAELLRIKGARAPHAATAA
jgi:hypothetical protein